MPIPSLLVRADADALLARLRALSPSAPRQWGKMDVAQMLAHVDASLRTALGELRLPRLFVGRLLGRLAKRSAFGEKPFGRGLPTATDLKVTTSKEFEAERAQVVARVQRIAAGGPAVVSGGTHAFFGPLTPDEWGILMAKHVDHHLRQFGA